MQDLYAAAFLVMPTHTGAEAAQLILRWFHIIAGITWVGLLYFFNLVNVPFMKQPLHSFWDYGFWSFSFSLR